MGRSALRLQLPVVVRLQQLREALGLAVLLVRELQPLVVEQPLKASLRRLLPRPLEAALGMVMTIRTLSWYHLTMLKKMTMTRKRSSNRCTPANRSFKGLI
jgi:hypothetical protein